MYPSKGTNDWVLEPGAPWFKKAVGVAHTHAKYDPAFGKGNDQFSSTDRNSAKKAKVYWYMVTPFGELRRYDPKDDSDIRIFPDINFPYDQRHPDR